MAIIWGFNLSEMRWGAFRHKVMFDKKWPLRRERFVSYQLAMLIGLAAECTATYSLSKYEDLQTHVEQLSGNMAQLHNNNIIDAAIVTIVFCVLVATIFGADFFFLVFWPQRRYPKWYDLTKLFLAVTITLGMGIAAFLSTITVARQGIWITGVDSATAQQYTNIYFRPNAVYKNFSPNIAWVVLIWPAFLATITSTYFMFLAYFHTKEFGTSPQPINEKDTESLPIRSQESKDYPLTNPVVNEHQPQANAGANRGTITNPKKGSKIPPSSRESSIGV